MYETTSGVKFVINTGLDWSSQAINEMLQSLHKEVNYLLIKQKIVVRWVLAVRDILCTNYELTFTSI